MEDCLKIWSGFTLKILIWQIILELFSIKLPGEVLSAAAPGGRQLLPSEQGVAQVRRLNNPMFGAVKFLLLTIRPDCMKVIKTIDGTQGLEATELVGELKG